MSRTRKRRKNVKKEKTGNSRVERGMGQIKSQFASASSARNDTTAGKAESLLSSPDKAPISPSLILFQKKKNIFLKAEGICLVDRQLLERNLSSQRKALLGHLFKLTSVDVKSTGDFRNFDNALYKNCRHKSLGLHRSSQGLLPEALDGTGGISRASFQVKVYDRKKTKNLIQSRRTL